MTGVQTCALPIFKKLKERVEEVETENEELEAENEELEAELDSDAPDT